MSAIKSIKLPHGGVVVQTSAGDIVLGMGPLTLKDLLALDESGAFANGLPRYQVFDEKSICDVAQFLPLEFLSYLPFLKVTTVDDVAGIRENKMQFVMPASLVPRLEDFLNLAATGLSDVSYNMALAKLIKDDHVANPQAAPQMAREIEYFNNHDLHDRALLHGFAEDRFAVSDKVVIEHKAPGVFQIHDGGESIIVDDFTFDHHNLPPELFDVSLAKRQFPLAILPMTTDHFFTTGQAQGSSGFLIFHGDRALFIDPPVQALAFLQKNELLPRLDGVLLTHTHGDHLTVGLLDLLRAKPDLTFYSSTFVWHQAKRLLMLACDDIDWDQAFNKMVFVKMQQPEQIMGLDFEFVCGFHTIPAFGFHLAKNGRHLLSFTGDSYLGRELLVDDRLVRDGVMAKARRDDLLRFFSMMEQSPDAVYLMEAGPPPIHTPIADIQFHLKSQGLTPDRLLFYHNTDSFVEQQGERKWHHLESIDL